MKTKNLSDEERLKYNQYHRSYYHRKKAEREAKAEKERLKAIEEKFNNEIKGGK